MGFKNYFCFHINTTLYFPISLIKRTFSNHKMKPPHRLFCQLFYSSSVVMTLFVSDQLSFSIQSGDQQYEETEQQIRRIGRQKSSRWQNRRGSQRKNSGTRSKSRKGRRRGAKKKKIGRPTWKPGPNQPWKKYSYFKQEIPRKQITS